MTRNQIDAKRVKEEARANKAREAEAQRSNIARESYEKDRTKETGRHNRQQERLGKAGILKDLTIPLINTAGQGLKGLIGAAAAQHPSWYDKYPELATGVGRYPFDLPVAANVKTNINVNLKGHSMSEGYLLVNNYQPVYGKGDTVGVSMLTTAAKKIYSNIRHANSGSSNYEYQDLMLNLMAIDGIYSMIAWLTRLYGVATYYQAQNRMIPKSLFDVYGVEESDVLNNIGPMYNAINMLINKASMFVQPGDMAITLRHMWLNSVILANPERPYAEMYMHNPKSFPVFEIDSESGAGKIVYRFAPSGTIQKLIDFVNETIDNLSAMEDSGIMAGDILKAYGDNVFKLGPIALDYKTPISTDADALEQFMNIQSISTTDGLYVREYQQGPSGIYSVESLGDTVQGRQASLMWAQPFCVRSYSKDITPAQVISRTRFISPAYQTNVDGSLLAELSSYGTEISLGVVSYATFQFGGEQATFANVQPMYISVTPGADSVGFSFDVYPGSFRINQFKYAPVTAMAVYDQASDEAPRLMDITNRAYYAAIPEQGIKQMHEVAVNSLFYSPGLTKFGF